MNYTHPEIAEHLARSYALGTLRGPARRRFERLLGVHPELDAAARRWRDWLMPLADSTPAIEPPAALWRAIERRTSPTRDARPPRSQRWLGLSWLGAAVAALGVLAIASLDLLPGEPRIDYVAVMAPEASSDAAVVVSARTEAQELTIELLRDPGLDADSDLELWAVSRSDGEARSLGLLSADARQSIAMTTAQTRLVREAETLLLTVEPAGGSPLGEPGGSVYASGLCVQLYADPSPPERG